MKIFSFCVLCEHRDILSIHQYTCIWYGWKLSPGGYGCFIYMYIYMCAFCSVFPYIVFDAQLLLDYRRPPMASFVCHFLEHQQQWVCFLVLLSLTHVVVWCTMYNRIFKLIIGFRAKSANKKWNKIKRKTERIQNLSGRRVNAINGEENP